MKIINFIKFQTLCTCLFNTLCYEMKNSCKAFLVHIAVRWLPWKNGHVIELWGSWFFHETSFLFEGMIDSQDYSDFWSWTGIFLNKVSMLLQGSLMLVANVKFWAFSQKLEFWKTSTWHCELDSCPIVKFFWWDWWDYWWCNFLILCNEMC